MGVLSGETEEVQAEVVEAPKRKPFTIWEVDGKEYRLKLTTSEIVSLESKLRVNLLTIISSADDGSLPPTIAATSRKLCNEKVPTWNQRR